MMKKFIHGITLALLLLLAMPVVVSAQTIPILDLNLHSRYTFSMADAQKNRHLVYVFSENEQRMQPGAAWSTSQDVVFNGEYLAVVARPGDQYGVVQDESLLWNSEKRHQLTFNISATNFRNRAYVLRSNYPGQPDLLLIFQQMTGSGDAALKAYFMDKGSLKLIQWQNKWGRLVNTSGTSGSKPLENTGFLTYKASDWARSVEYSGGIETIWQLDLASKTMFFSEEVLLNKAWFAKHPKTN